MTIEKKWEIPSEEKLERFVPEFRDNDKVKGIPNEIHLKMKYHNLHEESLTIYDDVAWFWHIYKTLQRNRDATFVENKTSLTHFGPRIMS